MRENLYKFSGKNVLPVELPKLNGINQDSFPDMGKASLFIYLRNRAFSTDVFSYNQSPKDLDQKHSDFMFIFNELNYSLVFIKSSITREN